MFTSVRAARRGLAMVALCGVLTCAATGAASAASPKAATTNGYTITNASSAILEILDAQGGVNVPAAAHTNWMPGQTFDFELTRNSNLKAHGDVNFEAFDVDGTDLGPLDLHFSQWDNNAVVFMSAKDNSGHKETNASGDRFDVYSHLAGEDSTDEHDQFRDRFAQDQSGVPAVNELRDARGGVQWDLDANTYHGPNGATIGQLAQGLSAFAGAANSNYDVSSVVPGYTDDQVLAEGYLADRDNPNDNPDTGYGSIDYTKGWSVEQTNSFGIGVDGELSKVIKAGVDYQNTTAFSTGHTFETGITADKRPGHTTQVIGQAPVITSHGDLQVNLPSTRWNFANADFSFPDANRMVRYRVTRVAGFTDLTSRAETRSGRHTGR